MKLAAHFCFYRTLYSQSAASVTVGTTAAALRRNGYQAQLTLLYKGDHRNAERLLWQRPDPAVLLLKVNFQDAAESLWLADALGQTRRYRAVLLMGVYAAGNAEHLMRMLPHVDGIVLAEPEAVVLALLTAIEQRPDWRREPVPGTLIRDEGGRLFRSRAPVPLFD